MSFNFGQMPGFGGGAGFPNSFGSGRNSSGLTQLGGANARNPMGGDFGGMQNSLMMMQQQAMSQMSDLLMQMFAQVMAMGSGPSGGGAGGLVPSSADFGGSQGGGSGVGSFLGGGGGSAPAQGASSASVNPGTPGAKGTGQAAVDMARKYLGRDSIGLKGDMPHFTAAGGVTNNCVDFVSSALESQGLVKGHHINVSSFEKQLKSQGWVQVPANQAKAGDVWINHSRGHTELVATDGATKLIGSNGSSRQKVSEHANSPSSGVIYQKR